MKKIFSIFLTATLVLSLAGCVSGGNAQSEQETEFSEYTSETESATISESDNQLKVEENTDTDSDDTKILVAYFSATGNTKSIAETIAELTSGDLYEIVPTNPYTDEDLNYSNDDCRANKEQNDDSARPEISGGVENMSDYDIVIIGHPIWWGKEPKIMDTFMESYDFSGKTVANFCTSGGSGISTATDNLKSLSMDANWLTGQRFETGEDSQTIQAWLDELGILN